jgi:hypothetical protein
MHLAATILSSPVGWQRTFSKFREIDVQGPGAEKKAGHVTLVRQRRQLQERARRITVSTSSLISRSP